MTTHPKNDSAIMRTALLAACALIIGFAAPRLMRPFLSPSEDRSLANQQAAAKRLCEMGANVQLGNHEGQPSSSLQLTREWRGGAEGLQSITTLPNVVEVEVACELSSDEIDCLGKVKTIRHVDISLATLSEAEIKRLKNLLPSAVFFGENSAVSSAEDRVSALR